MDWLRVKKWGRWRHRCWIGLCCGLLGACSSVPHEALPDSRPPLFKRIPGAPVADAPVAPPPSPSPAITRQGGGYYKDDGPGESVPPDLEAIPDAQPRREPIRAANSRPYQALGQSFTPMRELQAFSQTGIGSWYGKKFHGAKTSSGERYDMYAMSAAHPTLPLPSYARVTNLENGRSVVVRVNDRGPFLHSRIIDLSYTAAYKLGYVNKGSARLRVDAITPEEIESGVFARAPAQAEAVAASSALPDPIEALASAPMAVADASAASNPLVQNAHFLQLGAFSSNANAESYRHHVQSELKWLRHAVHAVFIGDKYRLRVGPFGDANEARSVAERIASALGIKPFLVQ